MTEPSTPRPSPIELLEGAFATVAKVEVVRDQPGREWGFALGVLFALGATDQTDRDTIARYEARIQAEANRLHGTAK